MMIFKEVIKSYIVSVGQTDIIYLLLCCTKEGPLIQYYYRTGNNLDSWLASEGGKGAKSFGTSP